MVGPVTLLFLSLSAPLQEDKRAEARRLEEKAVGAQHEEDRRRYLAEAWALRSEAFAQEERWEESREAWLRAREFGWTAPMPTRQLPQDREGVPPQEEENPLGVPAPEIPRPRTIWDQIASRPFRTSRSGVGHNLVHIPAFEEAGILPEGTWHVNVSLEMSLADFEKTAQGGRSVWNTTLLTGIAEVDYTPLSFLEAGIRLTVADLFSRGDDLVLFQNNIQVVPGGVRSFSLESIVPRVKASLPLEVVDLGVLAELKIPTAGKSDLLTAKTVDAALALLVSRRIDDWTLHGNLGIVVPFGDADVFRDRSDFSTLPKTNELATPFHFALGATWRPLEEFSFGIQMEGNTSPFPNIAVLDQSLFSFLIHGRYKMAEDAFFSLGMGTGFGDLASGFTLGISFDFSV